MSRIALEPACMKQESVVLDLIRRPRSRTSGHKLTAFPTFTSATRAFFQVLRIRPRRCRSLLLPCGHATTCSGISARVFTTARKSRLSVTLFFHQESHQLPRGVWRREVFGEHRAAHAAVKTAQQTFTHHADRRAKMAPRNSPELAMLYDRERQKGNVNRATLAVARKAIVDTGIFRLWRVTASLRSAWR